MLWAFRRKAFPKQFGVYGNLKCLQGEEHHRFICLLLLIFVTRDSTFLRQHRTLEYEWVVLLVPILKCRSGKPSSSGSCWIVLASIISKRSRLYSTGWGNSFWGLTTTWDLKPNMTQICVICVISVFLCLLIDHNPLIVSVLDSYWRSVVSVVRKATSHIPQGRVASRLFKGGETENYHFRFPFSLKACESTTTRKCEPNRQGRCAHLLSCAEEPHMQMCV